MPKKILNLVKNLLPWLIAVGLLFYLFHKIPPSQVLKSLKFVHLGPFLAFSVFYFILLLFLDTWTLTKVISKFDAPISFRELLPARCSSYLLSLVNYNAGQAGMALYLKKTRGLGFFKTLGNIFFVTATDLYWVIALAFFGSFFLDIQIKSIPLQTWVQRVSYIAFAALFLHIAFWRRWFSKVLPLKIHFGFADWIRGRHLFQPFHHATVMDYLRIALLRFPIHALIITSMWVVLRLFGATLPLHYVLATMPIIFLLGAIPLTPGGLGATQIATVEILKNQISSPAIVQGSLRPEELLFAMSLTWMFTNYFLKAIAGFIYLGSTKRQLFKEDSESKSQEQKTIDQK
jgi:uncharacterized membrane protein YbhN (UPF0104 family)